MRAPDLMKDREVHCPKCGRKTIVTGEADTKAVAPPSQPGVDNPLPERSSSLPDYLKDLPTAIEKPGEEIVEAECIGMSPLPIKAKEIGQARRGRVPDDYPNEAEPNRKCPYCSEKILATACPWCILGQPARVCGRQQSGAPCP
jgi:DNA-directed RNA polymerase subunit RPC12/RpoP